MEGNVKGIIASMVMVGLLMATACSKKESVADLAPNKNSAIERGIEDSTRNYEKSTEKAALENEHAENKSASNGNSQKLNQEAANRKVISKLYREIETTDFDNAMKIINERTTNVGGYIEESNIQGSGVKKGEYKDLRNGELVVRIPSNKINDFIKDVDAVGTILNSKQDGEDITFQYYDTETRVKTLKIQEERLLSLLEKSDRLQDIIDLERRLSEIRTEIESLTTTLKKYDNLVSLATVNIRLMEVEEEKELEEKTETFIGTVTDTFKSSVKGMVNVLKGLVIILAALLPFVFVIGIIAIPSVIVIKRSKRKKENERLQK